MELNNFRIFFMSVLLTTVVLIAVILFSYPAYALDAKDFDFSEYAAIISLDGDGSAFALPAKANAEPLKENENFSFSVLPAYVDSGESPGADKEENIDEIDDEFGQVIEEDEDYEEKYKPDFYDSGAGTGYPPVEESVYVIRSYLHFILFGLIPVFISVSIVYAFCKWFKRTFVNF